MIGVFDSGFGGLTVLRQLAADLPGEQFVYFGDNANAPYGPRPAEEIIALTKSGIERLFDSGCRLVLLACNTASAAALRPLQQTWLAAEYPDRRVLGVVVPVVEAITGQLWHSPEIANLRPHTIGIFGTEGTVRSGSYPREISKRAPAVRVLQQACPQLAGLIETDASQAALAAEIQLAVDNLKTQLSPADQLEYAVLGCTHYPLVQPLFAAALPGTRIISQPMLVSLSLRNYLKRHPEFANQAGQGSIEFRTSGDPAAASRLGSRFFGRDIAFHKIDC